MIVFTSVCANYIPKAKVLARSLKRTNPETMFVVCLTEREIPSFATGFEYFDEIVLAKDLGIPSFDSYIFKHSVVEASTSVKGQAFKYLFEKYPEERDFVFLDPDIVVYGRMSELEKALVENSIVLIPHIVTPEDTVHAIIDNEINSLKHGTYNLGFLAVRNDEIGQRFIDWWTKRLAILCYDNIPMGLFTDQKWVDLAPGFFDVFILRHEGYDVAPWNLSKRKITRDGDSYSVNGVPLRFFHFSGFDSGANQGMLARYASGKNDPVFELRDEYVRMIFEMGQDEFGTHPWDYDRFNGGERVYRETRVKYRTLSDGYKGNPFDGSNEAIQNATPVISSHLLPYVRSMEVGTLMKRMIENEQKLLLMESSKFWKLRAWYMRIKKSVFGSSGEFEAWKRIEKSRYLAEALLDSCRREGWRNATRRLSQYVVTGKGSLSSSGISVETVEIKAHRNLGTVFSELRSLKQSGVSGGPNALSGQAMTELSPNTREFVRFCELARTVERENVVMFIDHELGGGANVYRRSYIETAEKEGKAVAILSYNMSLKRYLFHIRTPKGSGTFEFDDESQFIGIFDYFKPGQIVVSELVSFPNPLKMVLDIVRVGNRTGADIEVLIHDFYPICPNFLLLYKNKEFCGVPDPSRCDECLVRGGHFRLFTNDADILKWRTDWRELLRAAKQVTCFSHSSKDILRGAYPDLPDGKIVVRPHSVDPLPQHVPVNRNSKTVTIGVLGEISHQKGSGIVKAMIREIERGRIDAKIVIIGTISEKIDSSRLTVTGKYDRASLPEIVRKQGVDIFFIPSIWPETFSYTTEEILSMGAPIAVFDIGAPAERVREYGKGIIIKNIDSVFALSKILEFAKKVKDGVI